MVEDGGASDDSPRARSIRPQNLNRTRVVLLGSGELGRELVIALQRLGAEVIAVDRRAGTPLQGVADQSVVVDMADAGALAATIGRLQPTYLVTATDAADSIAPDALAAAAETGFAEVVPSIDSVRRTADPEGLRRLAADELGLPTAPFWFVGSLAELRSVAEHAGYPMLVKPVAAPPGEGQSLLVRPEDVEPAWERAVSAAGAVLPVRVLAETVVDVDYEVTLLAACSAGPTGPSLEFCAPIGHRGIDGPDGQLVLESWQPQPMRPAALDAAKSVAARMVRALGGRGLFGVELMVSGDEVYFVDVTVRPYDVALLTLRTQRLSAFELQARAILGLPVDTIMISPGAARLTYAGHAAGGRRPEIAAAVGAAVGAALEVAESDVLVFGDDDGCPPRLAATVTTGSDIESARDGAARASAGLSRLWG